MLAVRAHDLVLRPETEPCDDDVAAVRGRVREGEVLGRDVHQGREPGPHLVAQGQRALEVGRPAPPLLERGPLLLDQRFDRGPRERPGRAGVQVREPFEDRELCSRLLEDHSIVRSTGA